MQLFSFDYVVFLFFFFLQYWCSCWATNSLVWNLNSTIITVLPSDLGYPKDSNQPDLLRFFANFSDVNLVNGNDFYAFPCFISPPSPRSYTFSICMDAHAFDDGFASLTAVVWSAHRNNPVQQLGGVIVSLRLQSDGNLVVVAGDHAGNYNNASNTHWSTNTANKGVVRMELSQYPVNLILYDSQNATVWQSMNQLTDTLTIQQSLQVGSKLVSWASPTDPSEGNYSLVVEAGGLVLYWSSPAPQPYWIWSPLCDPPTLQSAKNSSCVHGNKTVAAFVGAHGLQFGDSNNYDTILSFTDPAYEINMTLLRLDPSGNLHAFAMQETSWQTLYDLYGPSQLCSLPDNCGPYAVCVQGNCATCPIHPTFSPVNFSNPAKGCALAQPLTSCSSENASQSQQMTALQGYDYFSNAYLEPFDYLSEQSCQEQCLQNCSCLAAFWEVGTRACFLVDQMGSLQYSGNQSHMVILKMDTTPSSASDRVSKRNILIGTLSGLVALLVLCFLCVRRMVCADLKTDKEEDMILNLIPGLPTRFSYKELQSITNGFTNKLGQGAFGAVYAGVLPNGTKVAVKQLEGVKQGDKEFRSEVAIMGGIHHYHLLRLLGFCAQGVQRLLVYEYMENGSLDHWLFTVPEPLSWDLRCKIALGAARGLAYLHQECRETIIHLDIKPQNILLDENFNPKVADFGLSRLVERDKPHVVTTMRGTPGYLAPEWLKEGPIDEKCDVYSFGMLLMEIISGRKNLDLKGESEEKIYYPEWAFWQAQEGKAHDQLTNAKLENEEDMIQLKTMIKTAFLCVLENPEWRPSMEKVVQMLEGNVRVSHIQLSSLHQGLLFVLRNPSVTAIGQSFLNILVSSATPAPQCSTATLSSLEISGR